MIYNKTLHVEVTDGYVQQDISEQYLGITAPPGPKVRLRIRDEVSYQSVTASLTPDEARTLIRSLITAIALTQDG